MESLVEQVRDDPCAEVVIYATDPAYPLRHVRRLMSGAIAGLLRR
ncbi:hypothetical protein [Streptomyces syringium]